MNKLGIDDYNKMWEIEYYLFNVKYHLIDEYFTFNENSIFDVEYLEKLHIFLFNDIYDEKICKIKESITDKIINETNNYLNKITDLLYESDQEGLKEVIYKIWEEQIFYDGNTRTLLCFLKVLSKGFNIDINYDFTKDINKDYFISEVIDKIKIKQKRI